MFSRLLGVFILAEASMVDKAYLSGIVVVPPAPNAYRIIREIGSGSDGVVFLAKDNANGKNFALKSIKKPHAKPTRAVPGEISVHSSISPSHPNIVRFETWNEDDKYFHILTEYCDGGDLYEIVIQTENGLNESVAKRLVYQIGLAIKHLHDQGIVHRDVKAENVFMCGFIPKIGDFGLARKVGDSGTLREVVGTVTHTAPEMWRNRAYSFPVDIWSFGVMCFGLLFRRFPFDGVTEDDYVASVLKGEFYFPTNKAVSLDAKTFIHSLLLKNPNERPKIDSVLAHPWFDDVRKESTGVACTDVANTGGTNPDMAITDVASPDVTGNSETEPNAHEEVVPAIPSQDSFDEIPDSGLTGVLL